MKNKWMGLVTALFMMAVMLPMAVYAYSPIMDAAKVPSPETGMTGTRVTEAQISKRGVNYYFTSKTIDKTIFKRISGKSYGEQCTTKKEDLRYINVLYYGTDGYTYVGEMICHETISDSLLEIFKELYEIKFPIESMYLVDEYNADDLKSAEANNSSCFNFRISAGESGQLSRHAYGLAIDINPLYNPYVWYDKEGQIHYEPEKSKEYADRSKNFPQKLTAESECVKIFKEHGFSWGGDWVRDKDYMHFSKPLPPECAVTN